MAAALPVKNVEDAVTETETGDLMTKEDMMHIVIITENIRSGNHVDNPLNKFVSTQQTIAFYEPVDTRYHICHHDGYDFLKMHHTTSSLLVQLFMIFFYFY